MNFGLLAIIPIEYGDLRSTGLLARVPTAPGSSS